MKPANAKLGGSQRPERERSAQQSKTDDQRAPGVAKIRPASGSFISRKRADATQGTASQGTASQGTASGAQPATRGQPANEEPRTGVVRKVNSGLARHTVAAAPLAPAVARDSVRARVSRVAPKAHRAEEPSIAAQSAAARAWRCLEWGDRPSERPARNSKVSIAQLSTSGAVMRQTGPDQWLPDAGGFVHRMALLVAQGLGFERCPSVCLRSATGVISVSEAGPTKIVGVSGPLRQMSNVLRRVGLE